MFIDARGKACPAPVIMAKKAISEGCEELTVAVDNIAAEGNLKRLGNSLKLSVSSEKKEDGFYIRFSGKADMNDEKSAAAVCGSGYVVFIGKDHIGEGEGELGKNLMKMALYTLAQSEDVPDSILFMNSGVTLPAGEEQQVTDSLKEFESKGTEILVCGTCLNYYGLSDSLKVGNVSNMYDILSRMQKASKVITL